MRRPRRAMSEINVVPYIDVMLVLLIIFMVAAPLINPGQIDLPSVGQKANAVIAPLEVRVRANGELGFVDRARSTDELRARNRDQLISMVLAAQGANREQPVVISGDRKVAYEEVVQILDALQRNGVQKVGLLSRPATAQ